MLFIDIVVLLTMIHSFRNLLQNDAKQALRDATDFLGTPFGLDLGSVFFFTGLFTTGTSEVSDLDTSDTVYFLERVRGAVTPSESDSDAIGVWDSGKSRGE
jgi:hypothetical protein